MYQSIDLAYLTFVLLGVMEIKYHYNNLIDSC